MKGYATKLVDLIDRSPNEIAKHWCRDVKKNQRTPSFHALSDEELMPMAIEFYGNFRDIFFADQPFEKAKKLFGKYAEDRYRQGIPVQEAIYALVLMRRHIWLYAEFQAIFCSAVEQQQAAESLNRTILMFDYAIYVITEKYQSLIRAEVEKNLGGMKMILHNRPAETYQYVIISALVIAAGVLSYISHAVMSTGILFTHLFYIPIVLAGIWFRSRGIAVAFILAAILLASHVVFLRNVPLIDNLVRASMFIFVGAVVAKLTEGLIRSGFILERAQSEEGKGFSGYHPDKVQNEKGAAT
ncbi:MAG: hypothetical protein ACE14T_05485 [Syntrophales bacterium]